MRLAWRGSGPAGGDGDGFRGASHRLLCTPGPSPVRCDVLRRAFVVIRSARPPGAAYQADCRHYEIGRRASDGPVPRLLIRRRHRTGIMRRAGRPGPAVLRRPAPWPVAGGWPATNRVQILDATVNELRINWTRPGGVAFATASRFLFLLRPTTTECWPCAELSPRRLGSNLAAITGARPRTAAVN